MVQFCAVCEESSDYPELNCGHDLCQECFRGLALAALDAGVYPPLCPQIECRAEICQRDLSRLPEDVEARFTLLSIRKALGENFFLCPTKGCAGSGDVSGTNVFRCAECRLEFCVKCKSASHPGECWTEEDNSLKDYVQKKGGRRCPSCKFFIEKNGGCDHITCRCKFEFCYVCLAPWKGHNICRPSTQQVFLTDDALEDLRMDREEQLWREQYQLEQRRLEAELEERRYRERERSRIAAERRRRMKQSLLASWQATKNVYLLIPKPVRVLLSYYLLTILIFKIFSPHSSLFNCFAAATLVLICFDLSLIWMKKMDDCPEEKKSRRRKERKVLH